MFQRLKRALSSNARTKCVLSDMTALKIQTVKDLETKSKKRVNISMISSA